MTQLRDLVGPEGCEYLGLGEDVQPDLLLRTADEHGKAYGGFQWPTEAGKGVEAPDWDPTPCCGRGLHGAHWGEGEGQHLFNNGDGAIWYVVACNPALVVELGGKVKVPRVWILFCGSREKATEMMLEQAPGKAVIGSTLTGGNRSTLTGGDGSTLTGGYRSTLTGGDGSTLTGGYRSTLTGGDGSTLTGGNGSTLTGGDGSTLTGGDRSTLTFSWWDEKQQRLRKMLLEVGSADADATQVKVRFRGLLVEVNAKPDALLPGVAYRMRDGQVEIAE
jgi:hypothetical protein